jgi:hypothetical protein
LTQRRTLDLPGFLVLAPALVLFLYGQITSVNTRAALLRDCDRDNHRLRTRHAAQGPEALLDVRFRSGVFPVSAPAQSLQNEIVYATQMLLPLCLIKV